jgi:hypothetical protein
MSTVVTDPAAENHLVCSRKRRQNGVKGQRLQVLQNLGSRMQVAVARIRKKGRTFPH